MQIGYHAGHEQFTPRDLLDYIRQAEQAGFATAMSSEHIAPWSVRQGQSGFAWSWLGAALQATNEMSVGALAIPGGWRYHPVVVAHAFATLAQMFPGRVPWIAVGSGEAMNEKMIGAEWPDKDTRNARMLEAVSIMRALWRGETVTHDGLLKADRAQLWTLPDTAPAIYGAALSSETSHWMGGWADGLITVRAEKQTVQEMIDAFRNGGGAGKPLALQFQLSWAPDKDQARANAHDQWRHAAAELERDELVTPQDFDRACAHVRPHDMDDALLVTDDADEIIAELRSWAALGFERIYVHNAGRNQRDFIEFFGRQVLPHVL